MPNNDYCDNEERNNIINSKTNKEIAEDEIKKQINKNYIIIPKFLNKIAEYYKGKNKIFEEKKYLTFAEKLRNINQNIYDFILDMNTSFEIEDKIDNSSSLEDFSMKQYAKNKSHYDNFYGQSKESLSNEANKSENINFKEEYAKSFLKSVKRIFDEFNCLLNSKKENIDLPYYSDLETNPDSHIKFFKDINFLFRSLSKNDKNSNPNSNLSIWEQSRIIDIESRSVSSFSEFKINIIESVDEFITCIEDDISIDFIKLNTKNLNDLSFLYNTNLIYLKRLELRTNNIYDISPLKDCSCMNLINLNLSHNYLNNDSIEILLNMKLYNLEKLILFDNKITTIKILELGEKFEKLKKFHIGKNLINKKEIIENMHKFKLSESIENIGMSNNFNDYFSNQINIDLKFFEYISLENIKLLYLNRNDLYSLKCFENNNFIKLELVWLTYNHISDIEEIKYFHNEKNKKTLKAFLLGGNNIRSISDNFIKLLEEKFELNILNISLNPIKLENFKDKIEIIEKKGIRLLSL